MSTDIDWLKPVPRFQRMKYVNRLFAMQRELNAFADEFDQRGNRDRAQLLRELSMSLETPLRTLDEYWRRYGS